MRRRLLAGLGAGTVRAEPPGLAIRRVFAGGDSVHAKPRPRGAGYQSQRARNSAHMKPR